jgi:hypothetical protein
MSTGAVQETILRILMDQRLAIVAAVNSSSAHLEFTGLIGLLKRAERGLLLQPGVVDGDLLGIALNRPAAPAAVGRGVLVTPRLRQRHPNGVPIQVAHLDPADGPPNWAGESTT